MDTETEGFQTTKRTLLKTAAGIAATVATTTPTLGVTQPSRVATRPLLSNHEMRPLAFDPARLQDLSKKNLESHWSNNYGGSVRALNEINRRLLEARTTPDLPAYVYNDLKREHLMRTGSVILHELYFDNLGGNGQAPANLRSMLSKAFGTFDDWETEFRRISAGLGGGSGWVLFGYNQQFQIMENYWMADHMHAPATTVPLLVMDMYEHSYHMDFGASTKRYIDAFFKNINWDKVEARLHNAVS